jgi:hypothetical protein
MVVLPEGDVAEEGVRIISSIGRNPKLTKNSLKKLASRYR